MMSGKDYRDFSLVRRITKIEGELVNETPIRVGVGREPPIGAIADLAVYEVNGEPCIPGSSLKGVFRSLVESLAASRSINVHPPWENKIVEKEAEEAKFCPICGIFGSTEIASHVRIYDSYPKNGKPPKILKTGVSIDREFGGARPGALFTEELIPPGNTWTFRIDILNINVFPEPDKEDPRALLLKDLIDYVVNIGINVGARKSVGCGLIRVKRITWIVYSFEKEGIRKVGEGELP
jgi:CRISPR-associated RAMP protein (TIGR02581 family)